MKKLLQKITFQKVINTIVVVAVLIWGGYQIYYLIPINYDYYETLPDEVEMLDDDIEQQMEGVVATPELFVPKYSNPDIEIKFNTKKNYSTLSANEIYKRSLDSVVYINTLDKQGFWSFGSGSVIGSNGIILTNYHVIEGGDKIAVTFNNKETFPVVDALVIDEEKDFAILKIDTENIPALALGNSDDVTIGDDTYVIGHPENFLFTLSEGIISGKRAYLDSGEGVQFQITNPISAGSSGGALLNDKGELIGMPTSLFEYEFNSVDVQNINFAIPIQSVLNKL